jgi:hypothetical protein
MPMDARITKLTNIHRTVWFASICAGSSADAQAVKIPAAVPWNEKRSSALRGCMGSHP